MADKVIPAGTAQVGDVIKINGVCYEVVEEVAEAVTETGPITGTFDSCSECSEEPSSAEEASSAAQEPSSAEESSSAAPTWCVINFGNVYDCDAGTWQSSQGAQVTSYYCTDVDESPSDYDWSCEEGTGGAGQPIRTFLKRQTYLSPCDAGEFSCEGEAIVRDLAEPLPTAYLGDCPCPVSSDAGEASSPGEPSSAAQEPSSPGEPSSAAQEPSSAAPEEPPSSAAQEPSSAAPEEPPSSAAQEPSSAEEASSPGEPSSAAQEPSSAAQEPSSAAQEPSSEQGAASSAESQSSGSPAACSGCSLPTALTVQFDDYTAGGTGFTSPVVGQSAAGTHTLEWLGPDVPWFNTSGGCLWSKYLGYTDVGGGIYSHIFWVYEYFGGSFQGNGQIWQVFIENDATTPPDVTLDNSPFTSDLFYVTAEECEFPCVCFPGYGANSQVFAKVVGKPLCSRSDNTCNTATIQDFLIVNFSGLVDAGESFDDYNGNDYLIGHQGLAANCVWGDSFYGGNFIELLWDGANWILTLGVFGCVIEWTGGTNPADPTGTYTSYVDTPLGCHGGTPQAVVQNNY